MNKPKIDNENLVKIIADELFKSCNSIDCSDCRYQYESPDDNSFDPCSICYVKDTNWGLAQHACENIAKNIINAINRINKTGEEK